MQELARYIQEDRGESTDVTRHSLAIQLANFRKSIPAGHLVAKRFPEVFNKALEEVEEGLDELKELEDLFRLQKSRIEVDNKIETELGKLLPSMTAEMREARQTLQAIADIKADLGIRKRAPQQPAKVGLDLDIDVTVEGGAARAGAELATKMNNPELADVFTNPESRRRVLGVVDRFLRLPGGTTSDDSQN
jgi:hypothetical protein